MAYSSPCVSTFLIITRGRTCLTWLRQQPTQHIYIFKKVDVLWTNKLRYICYLLFYPSKPFFLQKKILFCAKTDFSTCFNEGIVGWSVTLGGEQLSVLSVNNKQHLLEVQTWRGGGFFTKFSVAGFSMRTKFGPNRM